MNNLYLPPVGWTSHPVKHQLVLMLHTDVMVNLMRSCFCCPNILDHLTSRAGRIRLVQRYQLTRSPARTEHTLANGTGWIGMCEFSRWRVWYTTTYRQVERSWSIL